MKTSFKNFSIVFAISILTISFSNAQEKYGNTINIGVGFESAAYLRVPAPGFSVNYEIDLLENVSLAPFVSLYHYTDGTQFWGGNYYKYSNTVVPLGVKGSYYFDGLFGWDKRFDVYAALSLGANLSFGKWKGSYNGPDYSPSFVPFYYALHAGGEYHFKEKLGVYVDLSTGISTVGLAYHL